MEIWIKFTGKCDLIILISVEVKMGATHSLGTFLRSHISSDFSPFKLRCLLFNREMQFYPSGHFWLLIRVLNSFPSKESKSKRKKSILPHLSWIIAFLWGRWPSGKSITLALGSASDPSAADWFTHLLGSLWEGQEKKCLPCMFPCVVLTVRWEEMYTKALWKWGC